MIKMPNPPLVGRGLGSKEAQGRLSYTPTDKRSEARARVERIARAPRDHVRRKRRLTYNPTSHRLHELERIIVTRHGSLLDTDDADLYLVPVAQALRRLYENKNGPATTDDILDSLQVWAQLRTPLVSKAMLRQVVRTAMRHPNMDKADPLAVRLRLTN